LDKVDNEEIKGSGGIQADMIKIKLVPEANREFCEKC
jgi:hypothetical protein